MKIECPGCKLSGTIDDLTVPATGLAMTCPRCKKPFTVEKPVATAGAAVAMLDSCPKCQYATFSDEKFAICPKCGMVVADYHTEQLAARQNQKGRPATPPSPQRSMPEQGAPPPGLSPEQMQKEEEARRKYGLDKVPGVIEVEEESASARSSVETPLTVLIAGWGVIVITIILVAFGISGIREYQDKVKEAIAAIAAFEEAQTGTALFFQFLLFPALSIIFSVVMLVIAAQFLRLKKWSIGAMHIGAWAGVGFFALMKIFDIIFWFKRASANASLGYYAMGIFGDVMLMMLYIAPFIALAEYLKSPLFEKSEDQFY